MVEDKNVTGAGDVSVKAAGARLAAGGMLDIGDLAALLKVSAKTIRRRLALDQTFPQPVRFKATNPKTGPDKCSMLRWRAADIRELVLGGAA